MVGRRLRPRAACSTSPSCSLTRGCPPNSASVRGRSADSILRSSGSSASAETSGRTLSFHRYAFASRAARRGSARAPTVRAVLGQRPDRVTGRSRPGPTSRDPPGPRAPGRARRSLRLQRPPGDRPDGAPILSLSSSTSRCAPFLPMPGTLTSWRDPRWRPPPELVRAEHREDRLGQLRADAGRGLQQLEQSRSSASANPYRVSESSRTTSEVASVSPGRAATSTSVPGWQLHLQARSPDLDHALSTPIAATGRARTRSSRHPSPAVDRPVPPGHCGEQPAPVAGTGLG